MNLFFDTSALVKFFHDEEGTVSVTQLITDQTNRVWLLELAKLEFISSILRRFRSKEINEEQLVGAVREFDKELQSFHVVPLGRATVVPARRLGQAGKQNPC